MSALVRRRRGFTLIELLVVIAIIAVLMGLLLPAIQKVREATNRMTCANSLKQMGIAVHSFHETQGKIPPSRIAIRHASWMVLIMPYLEQDAVYKQWDLSKEYYYQTPGLGEASVNIYYCPSRRAGPKLSVAGDALASNAQQVNAKGGRMGDHMPGALGDYACVSGDRDNNQDDDTAETGTGTYDAPASHGSFLIADYVLSGPTGPLGNPNKKPQTCVSWSGRLSFDDIVDGLSNTFFIGEKHVLQGFFGHGEQGEGAGKAGMGDGSIYNGNWWRNFARVGGPVGGPDTGAFPIAQSPTDKVSQVNAAGERLNNFPRVFGSYHPGICQFLLGDSSVRPVKNEIDLITLQRLNVRDDAQMIKDY